MRRAHGWSARAPAHTPSAATANVAALLFTLKDIKDALRKNSMLTPFSFAHTVGRMRLFALSLAALAAVGCSGAGGGSTAPPPVAPSIVAAPAPASAYIGATATFTVTATGTGPLTYSWALNGTAISGASASSYTTPALTAQDNGDSFTVTVSNSAGSVTSPAAKLTVSAQPPAISTQPASVSVQVGQTASFSVSATGTAPLTYQWMRNGTAISGASSSTYSLTSAQSSDSGAAFSVAVSNAAGSVTSAAATLTVTQVPVTITQQPVAPATLFSGETATLTVAATGTSPAYQWQKGGVAIPGATSASYTIPAVAVADDKEVFSVAVSNQAGSVTSSAVTIRVGPFPTAYTTQQGAVLALYAWPGSKMAILTTSNTLDTTVMRKFLTAADGTWNYYAGAVGQNPQLYFNYNGLATIAEVQSACGAGCTYIGYTGMEIEDPYFTFMLDGIPFNVYDQVMFYEMGRSFWLFEKKIGYTSPANSACLQTGFAVLMRFKSIAAQGYQGGYGPAYSTPPTQAQANANAAGYNTLVANNTALIDSYAANTSLTWSNTFATNTYSNPNGSCADLFSSVVLRLASNYGGEAFIQDLWKEVLKRPDATNNQDAVDNFVLAASAAAKKNLTGTFINQWRWPVSSAAQTTAQTNWGAPI